MNGLRHLGDVVGVLVQVGAAVTGLRAQQCLKVGVRAGLIIEHRSVVSAQDSVSGRDGARPASAYTVLAAALSDLAELCSDIEPGLQTFAPNAACLRGDLGEGSAPAQVVEKAGPDRGAKKERPDDRPAVGDRQRSGRGVAGPDGLEDAAYLSAGQVHQRIRAGARSPNARWLSQRTPRVAAPGLPVGGNAARSMAGTNSSPRLLRYM